VILLLAETNNSCCFAFFVLVCWVYAQWALLLKIDVSNFGTTEEKKKSQKKTHVGISKNLTLFHTSISIQQRPTFLPSF
jgi:hypothetical protein